MKQIARLLLLMLALAPTTFSQSTFGTIRGAISDNKGAAIANTTIRIMNQDESVAREVITDAQGNYEAPNLKAGRYQVTVKKDGFKEYQQSDLWLDARQVLRVDVSLQIGRIDETVTITGGAGVISTETQTVSSNLKSQQVLSLPANVRGNRSTSPYALVSVLPGVQSDNSFNFSIHGALPHQTEVTVDGISTVDVRRNGPQRDNFPSAESIAEMKVQAVGSNAEYGQVGDITTTSKGGTNQFHGSAFNYHQNAALDATPFGSTTRPAKVANTFGGGFGGPIFKERIFFFGAFEGMRFRSASTIQNLVPTQTLRNGDFSGLSVALRNPFNNNQPFANNRIPDNLINPVAKKILELYPLPNTTGAAVNFVENRPSPIDSDQYDIRIDHNLTSRQSLFGRWTWKDIDQQEPTRLEFPGVQRFVNSRNLVISHNYTITPSVLNEFRFGWSYRKLGLDFPFDTVAFARGLGLQGLGNLRPNVLPTLSFNGVITDLIQNRQLEDSKNYQFNNTTTWNWGRHTFKFGVDYRRLGTSDITTFTTGDDYGVYNFRGAFTGNNFADFLLGLPDAVTIAVTNVDVDGFANHYHFFAQDNFKISPKLTLEYGLRYELHAPFKDRNFNIGNFDRDTARTGRVIVPSDPRQKELAPVPNAVLNAINACGAPNPPAPVPGVGCTPVLSAKDAGFDEGLRGTDYFNLNPRFGFAYRPFSDNKTVVRGGFNIYTMTILGSVFYSLTASASSDVREFRNAQTPTGPAYVWPQTRAGDPRAATLGTVDFRTANQLDFKDPYSMQWNLSVEREFIWNTGVRITYVGMRGVHLTFSPDLNQPLPSTTPFNQRPLADRPFPNWNIVYSRDTGANSIYNALQLELSRRLGAGLTFSSAYTWAKNLSDAHGPATPGFSAENGGGRLSNSRDRRADRGDIGYNRRHRWISNFVYDLPFGKGRQFGGDVVPAVNALLGGWRLSGILLVQTGPFLTPTIGSGDPSGTNGASRGSQRPDLISGKDGNLDNPTADRWFDRSAFICPGGVAGQASQFNCAGIAPIGRFGMAGVGTLVGPGTFNLSMGLAKDFKLTERIRMKLEGTFTNLPNHPNLDDPSTNISSSQFGVITRARGADSGGNRVGQLALRIEF